MTRKKLKCFCWIGFFAGFLHAQLANAFIPTVTSSGGLVRWAPGTQLNLAGNPTNQSGLSVDDVRGSVLRGLQRWKTASGGALNFGLWMGTDPSAYPADSDYNGTSSFYFASNSPSGGGMASNVLGLTQVFYNPDNGNLVETDVELNDVNFVFTTNSLDTSGYGNGREAFSGGRAHVYIDNVVTHELGHAFGLSHSGALQSTMLYMEAPEQAHLSCDEQVAIHSLYPSGDANARGGISGNIERAGSSIFGAHVVAISRRRGVALASTITDPDGNFSLGALEPGEYYLLIEPFLSGAQTLSGYYANMNDDVCGGRAFSRTFWLAGDGQTPLSATVVSGQTAQIGTVQVACQPFSANSVTSPQFDLNGQNGFGFVDRAGSATGNTYQLKSVQGHLEVRVLSYSLYSPVGVQLSLLTSSGAPVNAQFTEPAYIGDSGYQNFDGVLVADGLPAGDYVLKATVSAINSYLYPGGPVDVDASPFFVLAASLNEPAPALAQSLAANPRCRAQETFTQYQQPPGPPPKTTPITVNSNSNGSVGFCGQVRAESDALGPESGNGAGAGAIISWFLPWIVAGVGARVYKIASRSSRLPA